jgi:hypothetical protein
VEVINALEQKAQEAHVLRGHYKMVAVLKIDLLVCLSLGYELTGEGLVY